MSFEPSISPKQATILNTSKKFNLITGPRLATKSIGCLHDIPWHMWNTNRAIGMMLGKTTSQNADAGLWKLLIEDVIPEWVAGDFGFEWVTMPRMEAVTHKLFFETTNRFDTVSRYYLDSLDVEEEAEKKFKGKIFSHIYWTELSNFKYRTTFDVLQECFRVPYLRPEQHKLIADTNPAAEGEDSWIWKLWYWFRTIDLDNLTDDAKEDLNLHKLEGEEIATAIQSLKELQADLDVNEFTIDDNIFITPAQKRGQWAKYAHNKDLLDRYYYGKWVRAAGDSIFSEVWRPEIHVIGEPKTSLVTEPEMLVPEEGCRELGAGWDVGSRRNSAVAIIEPVLMEVDERDSEGNSIFKTGFKILDEFVSLGEQQKISMIAEEVMEKVEFWEKMCGRKPLWRHYSDNSAFAVDSISETDEAKEIFRLSSGEIELQSITARNKGMKGHGAVERRVNMVERLLFENRIAINQATCPNIVEMFGSIKRDRRGKLSTTNIFKHAFDAISYYMAMKVWEEMMKVPRGGHRTTANSAIVVTRL
jgi:hypothetical protein